MTPKLKICGLTNKEDILLCVDKNVDFLGFNFYFNSKRYVKPESLKDLFNEIDFKSTKKVGIFVNSEIGIINHYIELLKLDFVQIIDNYKLLNFEDILCPVIDTKFVTNNTIPSFNDNVPFILDNSGEDFGGNGTSFNLDILNNVNLSNCFLSGGICFENLNNAISLNPYAIDICSCSERAYGIKDYNKLLKIISFFN